MFFTLISNLFRYIIMTSSSCLLMCMTLASICYAAPLDLRTTASLLSRQSLDAHCAFTGNSDLYGLGIRVGIYLQWVSAFLANLRHADAVQDMLATNTIFLMALFIALAIITANQTVRAAEVVILLQLCFGFLFTVSSTWGLRVRATFTSPPNYGGRIKLPLLGSTIRICLATAICIYNVWFWFTGIDKLNVDPTCNHGASCLLLLIY